MSAFCFWLPLLFTRLVNLGEINSLHTLHWKTETDATAQQSSPSPLPPPQILIQSNVNQSALLLLLIDKQSLIKIKTKRAAPKHWNFSNNEWLKWQLWILMHKKERRVFSFKSQHELQPRAVWYFLYFWSSFIMHTCMYMHMHAEQAALILNSLASWRIASC